MTSARPSRIDKSFYLDSNLQDRKLKGRPQNCRNDQSVCSSQFNIGVPRSVTSANNWTDGEKLNSLSVNRKLHESSIESINSKDSKEQQIDTTKPETVNDRKQKGRPINCRNDQTISQFALGSTDSTENNSKLWNNDRVWTSKPKTVNKAAAAGHLGFNAMSQTEVPTLDLNTSTDRECDFDCASERGSIVSELSNDPYHRTLTPVTPVQVDQYPKVIHASHAPRNHFQSQHSTRFLEHRPGSGTPRNRDPNFDVPPPPSKPSKMHNVKEAWNDRSVKFSSASPDVRVMSGRGDSEYTDSARSWTRDPELWQVKESPRQYHGLIAPYGTSNNNGYMQPSAASPTKKQSYKRRNQSNIFG